MVSLRVSIRASLDMNFSSESHRKCLTRGLEPLVFEI